MSASHLPTRRGCAVLVLVGLLLSGCQSCTSDESSPPTSQATTEQTRSPRALATDYLRYAYQGALLSSDHPLNDSLSVLLAGAIGGRTLTIIDTFAVDSVQSSPEKDVHTVRVRFPKAVQIQSATWTTDAPTTDVRRSIRLRRNQIHEAPHVVGWPAFQDHLRDVAPAAADSVLERLEPTFRQSPPEASE